MTPGVNLPGRAGRMPGPRTPMPVPDFLGQALRGSSRRYELVHAESGALLASRVSLDSSERRLLRSRLSAQRAPGTEAALIVAPARALHTCFAAAPLDAAFVGADGTILGTRRDMKPWRVAVALKAHAVIEAAPGFLERYDLQIGDRVMLREAQPPRPAREVSLPLRGFGKVPEPAKDANRESGPDAIREIDAEPDPWDLGSEEPAPLPAAEQVVPRPSAASPPAAARGEEPVRAEAAPHAGEGPAQAEDRAVAPQAPVKAPRRAAQVRGATLAKLVARQTPIEWFEGVAIVQGLCSALLDARGGGGRGVPEAEAVAITAGGGVELLAEGSQGAPASRVARLLHGLVEGTALPVQLRLLILQELSPSPGCASVLAFSTRLALFERPGREHLIRAVYERFTRLPPREAESLTGASRPATPAVLPAPQAWWRWRTVQVASAAALLVLALPAAAIWLWQAASTPPPGAIDRRGPAARAVAAAGKSVSEAAAGGAGAVSRWLGLKAADRPAPAPAAEKVEPPAPGPAPPRRPGPRMPKPLPPGPDAARAPAPAPSPGEPNTTVYSRVDTEVAPPSLVRSRLPEGPPLGIPAEGLPEVELVVSSTGEVESVKLVSPQAGVGPSMMLSAIKAWRFHPATRDGEPVRYRLRMRLTNQ